jgi:hypothetical protein
MPVSRRKATIASAASQKWKRAKRSYDRTGPKRRRNAILTGQTEFQM